MYWSCDDNRKSEDKSAFSPVQEEKTHYVNEGTKHEGINCVFPPVQEENDEEGIICALPPEKEEENHTDDNHDKK